MEIRTNTPVLHLINDGLFRDECPLDTSPEFARLCVAVRRGDLKSCQECITTRVDINARDEFDYTPLILASLCGHYEIAQLLLESGALCERDTFQGERCLYNALNSRIRNLLLQYEYSKNTDPLQPLSSYITSLLSRTHPQTSDITLTVATEAFHLHKFILAARSPYFQKKLFAAPETRSWKMASTILPEAVHVALRYLYLGELPSDLGVGSRSQVSEEDVINGINMISKQLEIEPLWIGILSRSDRKSARQWHQGEVTLGRDQLEAWFRDNVLKNKIEIDANRANDVKWTRDNVIFADVLLRADEEADENEDYNDTLCMGNEMDTLQGHRNPAGPVKSKPTSKPEKPRKSVLFPVHRAMIIRAEYFLTMFSSSFQEAQVTTHLHIVGVDCSPEVLEVVLNFLYTETAEFPLEMAVDVLYAADMLFIDKLKTKASTVISTLGDGRGSSLIDRTHVQEGDEEAEAEPINVYEVIHAAWVTRVQRLEEFAARYLANRLEDYIDEPAFEDLIKESASRIRRREETDTIELLDDIRYYLSERFRLRFEDVGLQAITEGGVTGSAEEGMPAEKLMTLDGAIAEDEFVSDAINYEVLLRKIDALLERLKLDA